MSTAQNIMVVIKPTSEIWQIPHTITQHITQRIIALRHQGPIRLGAACLIPSLPAVYYQIPSTLQIDEQQHHQANRVMSQVGHLLGVPKRNQWLIENPHHCKIRRLLEKEDVKRVISIGLDSSTVNEISGAALNGTQPRDLKGWSRYWLGWVMGSSY